MDPWHRTNAATKTWSSMLSHARSGGSNRPSIATSASTSRTRSTTNRWPCVRRVSSCQSIGARCPALTLWSPRSACSRYWNLDSRFSILSSPGFDLFNWPGRIASNRRRQHLPQAEHEHAALAGGAALEDQVPAVQARQLLADGQAQAEPGGGAGRAHVHAVEPLEDAPVLVPRYAVAPVQDRHLDHVAGAPHLDGDLGRRRAVRQGVVEQVVQDQRDVRAVDRKSVV